MWMTQAVHRSLRLQPQRAATIHNGRTRTVAESADRIARLAGALAALGVTDDDRVGILAHNSDRYHEALMAIPWSGGVVNPINTRWALPEMVYALDESGVEILFVDQAFTNLVPELRERLPGLAAVIHMADGPRRRNCWITTSWWRRVRHCRTECAVGTICLDCSTPVGRRAVPRQ